MCIYYDIVPQKIFTKPIIHRDATTITHRHTHTYTHREKPNEQVNPENSYIYCTIMYT